MPDTSETLIIAHTSEAAPSAHLVRLASSTGILDTSALTRNYNLRNHARVTELRRIYASVTVVKVSVELVVLQQSVGTTVLAGVTSSQNPVPADFNTATQTPGTVLVPSSTTGGTRYSVVGDLTGLELDLAQTSIRGGHPMVRFVHDRNVVAPTNQTPAVRLATAVVHFDVACSGAGSGFSA
jgi:hypothetical protein